MLPRTATRPIRVDSEGGAATCQARTKRRLLVHSACKRVASSRRCSGESSTTVPSRQMYIGRPWRACSTITFSTAALSAISARSSNGIASTFAGGLVMAFRSGQSENRRPLGSLYWCCPASQKQSQQVSRLSYRITSKNRQESDIAAGSCESSGQIGGESLLQAHHDRLARPWLSLSSERAGPSGPRGRKSALRTRVS
jgi:hypothetical protein